MKKTYFSNGAISLIIAMFVTECDLNGYDVATKLGGEK